MHRAGTTIKTPPITNQLLLGSLYTVLLCLLSFQSHAQTVDWRTDFNSLTLNWIGSGDLVGTSTGCIHSSTRSGNSGRTRRIKYGIMGIQSFSGDFIASDGSNDMVLELSYENMLLSDGVFTGASFRGSKNCNSVTLDVRVTEAELQALPGGTYTTAGYGTHGRLIICATTDRSGVKCLDPPSEPYEDSDLEISIVIPAYTRLFNVGDFTLPSYDGVSASVSRDMQFCVKSTASSAGYILTATSDTHHGGDSNSFAISNNSGGSETIPYTLLFAPSVNPDAGSALASGVAVGPFTGSRQNQCGGGNNASMQVQVNGADIRGASAGNYSGVITIKVEPN